MQKITRTLFIGLVFILASCQDENGDNVRIRIRNIGEFNYDNLIVNSVHFGFVSSNKTSKYRQFEFAYQYSSIQFSIDGVEYRCIPDCLLGEERLKKGKYTYEIVTDSNKQTRINLIRE